MTYILHVIHAYFNLEDPLSFFGKVLHLIGAMLEKLKRLGFSLGVTGKYRIVKQMLCTFCRHFGLLCSNFLDSTLCQYTAIMYLFFKYAQQTLYAIKSNILYIRHIFVRFPEISLCEPSFIEFNGIAYAYLQHLLFCINADFCV